MARVSSEPGRDGGGRGGDHPSGVCRGLRHLQCTLGKIHGLEEKRRTRRARFTNSTFQHSQDSGPFAARPTCEGMSQNRGLGTVSQSVPRSVSSSVTTSSPLSSSRPAASGSTNSIDSSRSALTSNGPVLDRSRNRREQVSNVADWLRLDGTH